MFDGLLGPAPEVLTSTPHVFAKMFATAQDAAVFDISTHALAGPADLCAALLHLPFGSVVILLSNDIQRGQDQRKRHRRHRQKLDRFSFHIHPFTMHHRGEQVCALPHISVPGQRGILAEQAIIFRSDNLVTFADAGLQPLPIEDRHIAANIANVACGLQPFGGVSYSFAAHAQHVRNQILRHN
jgi:hypothetical protein